jgi:hypothetical protein
MKKNLLLLIFLSGVLMAIKKNKMDTFIQNLILSIKIKNMFSIRLAIMYLIKHGKDFILAYSLTDKLDQENLIP